MMLNLSHTFHAETGGCGALGAKPANLTLQHLFLQALHKAPEPLDGRTAEVLAQKQPALLGFLPEWVQLYDVLCHSSAPPDSAALVHERLNRYARTSAAFQAATAAQLLYECRILRRVMLSSLGQRDAHNPRQIDVAHDMVDACTTYVADAFVHEEELLRQSRNKFSEIIDTIPQLVWRTTVDGEATFANRPFLEHVGCTLDQVLGWGWLGFVHPEDRAWVGTEWRRCRNAELPVSVAFRVRGVDGSYRWFLSLGNPFYDNTHTLVAYYGTWTDIDEYKQIEARLKQAVSARDEFLCIASHELKTPLTALQLQVQMRARALQRCGNPSVPAERVRDMLAAHSHQLERITRLVNDMLDVARLDSGTLSLNMQRVELGALVRTCVEHQHAVMEAAGCSVQVQAPAAGLLGTWDPYRLEQALTNLLNNCSRYAAGCPVDITVTERHGQAVVEVADGGPGIAPQHQARVFGRFERAISANERSGLGLGLYIVREILALHGGSVALSSPPESGCRFVLTLPVDPANS